MTSPTLPRSTRRPAGLASLAGRAALLVAIASAAATAPGCVSGKDIEGLQGQIGDVQRQVFQLQQQAPSKEEVSSIQDEVAVQMQALLKSEADMQVKLGELSRAIDQLQANLEDTNFRLSQLSQQIAATNQELQNYRTLIPQPASSGPTEVEAPTRAGYTGDPRVLYQTAYNDYLRGSYDLAVRGFEEYLENFPSTDLADNAVYWIGESYYRQGQFQRAARQFEQVLESYPRSDKAASSLLKRGYAQLELGQRSAGVSQLRTVVERYPTSDEANLARQRLRDLGIDIR